MSNNFQCSYMPIMQVKLSEMRAVAELSGMDKDALVPLFLLRSWANSNHLSGTADIIKERFGERYWFADVDDEFLRGAFRKEGAKERPVREELIALKNPSEGYKNWCDFVASSSFIVPCLQLDDLSQLNRQISNIASLERRIAVRFTERNLQAWKTVFPALTAAGAEEPFVFLDYGLSGYDFQERLLELVPDVISVLNEMHRSLPNAVYVLSSTTFPAGFSGIDGIQNIPIYERDFFNRIKSQCPDLRLVYSDRASTRARNPLQSGKGSPRIDYPLSDQWVVSRTELSKSENSDEKIRNNGFIAAASALVANASWDGNLQIWGAKEIEAASKAAHITTAGKATAVRINIHLCRQIHYGASADALVNTDEDWVD